MSVRSVFLLVLFAVIVFAASDILSFFRQKAIEQRAKETRADLLDLAGEMRRTVDAGAQRREAMHAELIERLDEIERRIADGR